MIDSETQQECCSVADTKHSLVCTEENLFGLVWFGFVLKQKGEEGASHSLQEHTWQYLPLCCDHSTWDHFPSVMLLLPALFIKVNKPFENSDLALILFSLHLLQRYKPPSSSSFTCKHALHLVSRLASLRWKHLQRKREGISEQFVFSFKLKQTSMLTRF